MLNIVLVEPEIPQNCGNIARTCAATGSRLHLVRPLGFDISDKAVKRAGLDYWHLVEVTDYDGLEDLFARHPEAAKDLWLTTTKAPRSYQEAAFSPDCWLFFGKETAGLPQAFREQYYDRCIRLPMISQARSLNLSNTVAVCVYEALRQNDFPGLLGTGEMAGGQ
jgi:tRNA (cytidine/uridine-2'-O-)-methyltransferase